jgi:hypothetical protein
MNFEEAMARLKSGNQRLEPTQSEDSPDLIAFRKAIEESNRKKAAKGQTIPETWEYETPLQRFQHGARIEANRAKTGLQGLFGDISPEQKTHLHMGDEYMQQNKGTAAGYGKTAVNALEMLPLMAIPGSTLGPAAARVAGAGGLSAMFEPENRGSAAVSGALGAAAGEGIPLAMGVIHRATQPFYAKGREDIIHRLLNERIGPDRIPDVLKELDAGRSRTPGVEYTASEAAPSSGAIGAMQRWAEQAYPEGYEFRKASNMGARRTALRGIAGTEFDMAAAEAARTNAAEPLYQQAKQQMIPVDDEFRNLLNRPSMKGAFEHVKRISAEQGRPISDALEEAIKTGNFPTSITGDELHLLKLGLDSFRKDPQNPLSKELQRAVGDTISQFEKWRETNIPVYAQAQTTYRDLSRPINRYQIGQEMYERLAPALADIRDITRERPEMFARSLRDLDQVAQKATGYDSARFDRIMEPGDLDIYKSVAEDLTRGAQSALSGRGVGSNTFQNLYTQNLADRGGVVGGGLNSLLRNMPIIKMGEKITQAEAALQRDAAEMLLDPARTAMAIRNRPGGLSRILDAQYGRYPSWMGAVGSNYMRQ